MNSKYLQKTNEKILDYAMRLIEIKKEEKPDDLDWQDIVDLLGLDLNKDSLRKSQDTEFGGIAVYKKMKEELLNKEPVDYQEEVRIQLEELKKERVKLSDERASLNRRLREKARQENLCELAKDYAKEAATVSPFSEYPAIQHNGSQKSAILTLSDFHYGLVIEEFNNEYNPIIFSERITQLYRKVCNYIDLNNVENLYVLGLGDYLSGIIHTTIRIENRESIIKQVMDISEMLAKLLYEFSKYCNVYYYDVSDNHGRVFSNKDENLNNENFSLFVKWYLKARFEGHDRVFICENEINEEIGLVTIYGRNYGFTHGHRDKISDIVQNMSLMTKKFFDAIFIAHSHHFEANEVHGTYVYMNGTLSGTDAYANNARRTSNPSQNLFIINEKDGIECQYLIRL